MADHRRLFGGIGTWALTAPLNGAVVANAVVKVDGNRKASSTSTVASSRNCMSGKASGCSREIS